MATCVAVYGVANIYLGGSIIYVPLLVGSGTQIDGGVRRRESIGSIRPPLISHGSILQQCGD